MYGFHVQQVSRAAERPTDERAPSRDRLDALLEQLDTRLHTTDPLGFLRLLIDAVLEAVDGQDAAPDFGDLLFELAHLDTPDVHRWVRRWLSELVGEVTLQRLRAQRIGLGIFRDHVLPEK